MAQINFGILDTSIPIQASEIGERTRRNRLVEQQQMRQNALADFQMQRTQKQMADEDAERAALGQYIGGGMTPELEAQLGRQSPQSYFKIQDLKAKQAEAQRKTQADSIDMAMKRADLLGRAAGIFASNPTREAGRSALQWLGQTGAIDNAHLQQMAAQFDQTPDEQLPALAQQFLAGTEAGQKALVERQFPSMTEFDKSLLGAGLKPGTQEWRAASQQRAAKMATHAPSSTAIVNMPLLEREEQKEKGKSNVKLYDEVRTSANAARKIEAQIDSQRKILDSGFDTGFGTEAKAAAASVLSALGVKDAAKYAGDAQSFKAGMLEVVLNKQLAQKGPQTESDALRMQQAGAQLTNVGEANRYILDIAKAQVQRETAAQKHFDEWWRKNGTYEGAEASWYDGRGGKSLFDEPVLQKYSGAGKAGVQRIKSDAEFNALPSGTMFIGPDGKQRRKP
jgi:hypothetical protein